MKTSVITAGGQAGCLFEGEIPQTYCFVPENVMVVDGEVIHLAEGDYIRSGWDVRNMRFNETSDGQHLFPDTDRPIYDMSAAPVRTFLRRIQLVRPAPAA